MKFVKDIAANFHRYIPFVAIYLTFRRLYSNLQYVTPFDDAVPYLYKTPQTLQMAKLDKERQVTIAYFECKTSTIYVSPCIAVHTVLCPAL